MLLIQGLLSLSTLVLFAFSLPAPEQADGPSACLSSWHSYDAASTAWFAQTFTVTLTTEILRPDFDYEVPYITLCDGYRRAVVSRTTTRTTTYDPPTITTMSHIYTEPAPTCTIGESACTAILSSRSSSMSDYLTNDGPSPGQPHCTTYIPCNTYCAIYDWGSPTVWYWPVTTMSGDFCAYNGSTIFNLPTNPPNPNTVITGGHTFTSPTNYISFEHLDAGSKKSKYGARTYCGTKSYDNIIVPVTGAFTTKGLDQTRSSLNFEDLNTMKFEEFKAQRRCRNNDCTVIEGFYTPELALPTEVLDLEPVEWKAAGCKGTDVGTSWYHPRMVPLVTPAPVVEGKST